jgi:hypothetical protein
MQIRARACRAQFRRRQSLFGALAAGDTLEHGEPTLKGLERVRMEVRLE